MHSRLATVLALAALTLGASARAAEESSSPQGDDLAKKVKDQFMLGMGLGQFEGDFYVLTTGNFELNLGKVGVGISAPLNLLAWNNDATGTREEKAFFGVIRKSDWDELDDFGKIIRFVRFGQKREPLHVLAGELWGAGLGHGTLVNRYTNALLVNHKRAGLVLDVNTAYGGIETLVDNVLGPTILGGRLYLRPLAFGNPDGFFAKRFAVGASFFTDRLAPRTLKYADADSDGSPETLVVTAEDDLGVPDRVEAQMGVGVDVELVVLESSILDIIPYLDFNRLLDLGNGLHAGVLFDFEFPLAIKLNLSARLEYRMLSRGYQPVYFDQFYDVQRVSMSAKLAGGTQVMPKAAAARAMRDEPGAQGKQGIYGEASLDLLGWVQAGLLLEDYQGENNGAVGSYLALPAFDTLQLTASYYRKDFEGLKEAFKLDERSILTASARYNLWGPAYITAFFSRSWKTKPGPPATVEPEDNWGVGFDLSFQLPSFM